MFYVYKDTHLLIRSSVSSQDLLVYCNCNGHSCSSPFEQLIDRDINLTNQWAEVRLHEELQKISATQLMDAMLQ